MPTCVRTEEKGTAELRVRIWASPAPSLVTVKDTSPFQTAFPNTNPSFSESRLLFVCYRLRMLLETESTEVPVTGTKTSSDGWTDGNSWLWIVMFPYGVVPGSFIALHHFTASLNGGGELERLKFTVFFLEVGVYWWAHLFGNVPFSSV